jgi:AraC-like DNA-binding protein
MQNSSTLSQLLSTAQRRQAEVLLAGSEIELLSCLFWWMDIAGVIPRRRLADSLLYVPKTGRMQCRVGDQEQTIGPGECLLVAEGVEHEARLAEGCSYFEAFALHAHAYTTESLPLFAIFTSPFGRLQPPEAWFEQLEILTHLMGQSRELGRRFGEPWLRSLLLHQLRQGVPLRELPTADDPRMWRAVSRILNGYAGPLSIEELAREAGLSPVQFRKRFGRYTGTSPKEYLQQLRLRKAHALFQSNPELTVKEVAAQVGFHDPNFLHLCFKALYGLTPGECRRQPRVP